MQLGKGRLQFDIGLSPYAFGVGLMLFSNHLFAMLDLRLGPLYAQGWVFYGGNHAG